MERPNLARKDILSPKEASAHFELNQRRFYALLKEQELGFVAYYGARRLIIRTEFENYLKNHPEIRRQKNGRSTKR